MGSQAIWPFGNITLFSYSLHSDIWKGQSWKYHWKIQFEHFTWNELRYQKITKWRNQLVCSYNGNILISKSNKQQWCWQNNIWRHAEMLLRRICGQKLEGMNGLLLLYSTKFVFGIIFFSIFLLHVWDQVCLNLFANFHNLLLLLFSLM